MSSGQDPSMAGRIRSSRSWLHGSCCAVLLVHFLSGLKEADGCRHIERRREKWHSGREHINTESKDIYSAVFLSFWSAVQDNAEAAHIHISIQLTLRPSLCWGNAKVPWRWQPSLCWWKQLLLLIVTQKCFIPSEDVTHKHSLFFIFSLMRQYWKTAVSWEMMLSSVYDWSETV